MLKTTTALRKLAGLKNRIWGVQGGQGAAKTFSILILIVNHLSSTPGKRCIVASEELTKMRLTVIDDFFKILKIAGVFNPWKIRDGGTRYIFPNGSVIKFIGLDKEDIGKGLRSDILFINEANKVYFESYRQLASRAKRVIIDFNPDLEFWYHTEVKPRPDCSHIVLTFLDNEELSPEERAEIIYYKLQAYHDPDRDNYDKDSNVKSAYWRNKWRVYGLGLPGRLEGVIFNNWEEIATVPPAAKLIGYGQDFGFTNDPSATTAVYEYNGKLVLDELIYQTGLLANQLAREYEREGMSRGHKIWADESKPESIKELSGYGWKIAGARKPKDSIVFGIDLLQSYQILITARSENLKEEFKTYTWAKDRTGKHLNVPIDKNNHGIDGVRYLAIEELSHYKPRYKSKTHGKDKDKRGTRGKFYEDFL